MRTVLRLAFSELEDVLGVLMSDCILARRNVLALPIEVLLTIVVMAVLVLDRFVLLLLMAVGRLVISVGMVPVIRPADPTLRSLGVGVRWLMLPCGLFSENETRLRDVVILKVLKVVVGRI